MLTLTADLASDLAYALDPALLATRLGITPDPWQARVLRSPARQFILNTSRQVGKSTITGVLAAHAALYEPGAPVLLLSPSLRQSGLLFAKVKAVLRALGSAFSDVVTDNALSVTLGNGSEIHSLPGKAGTVRGFSGVHTLIIDEAAYVPDDLYRATRPMLAVSRGRLVLLSTPFGRRGFFHDEWTKGGPRWERVEVTYQDCPRITPDFIAEEQRALGIFFEQEYCCQFLDTTNQLFRGADIDAMMDPDVLPLFPIT